MSASGWDKVSLSAIIYRAFFSPGRLQRWCCIELGKLYYYDNIILVPKDDLCWKYHYQFWLWSQLYLRWFFFVQVVSLSKKCEMKSIYLRKLFMQINWRICAKDSDYVACPEPPRITTNPNVFEVVLQFYPMWRHCNPSKWEAKQPNPV